MMPSPTTFQRVPIFALLLFVIASTGAMAQPTVSVRGNVGASFFRSPEGLSEVLHSGVDMGVGANVQVYRGLSVTVHGGYDQFTLNEETARLFNRIEAGDLSFLSGALGVRYTYVNESDAHPYVTSGVGVYRVSSSNRKVFQQGELINRKGEQSFTDLGIHLAIGSLFRMDETYAVFFEPRYVLYVKDRRPGIRTSALRYFSLRLGVEVRLN